VILDADAKGFLPLMNLQPFAPDPTARPKTQARPQEAAR
jgi:hypothetical protein